MNDNPVNKNLNIINRVTKDLELGLKFMFDNKDNGVLLDESNEALKTVLQIVVLGSYLENHFDDELMRALQAYNRAKNKVS